jgi:hypothetical protein
LRIRRLTAEGVKLTFLAAAVKDSARPATTKISTARSGGKRDFMAQNSTVSSRLRDGGGWRATTARSGLGLAAALAAPLTAVLAKSAPAS